MKRTAILTAAGLLAAIGFTASGFADQASMTLENAWARPSIGNATNSAAYFTLTDNGTPDRLVGVSTPIGKASVHETIDDNGVMKMRGVSGVALGPGKPVTFKPGGYHVMLMDLKAPLKAGDSFPLTLTFEHAAPITTQVKVEARTMPSGMQGMQGGMQEMGGMHDQKPH
ncbi:copper chaperone PCu(A)C [Rhodopila sp.]|uniref:copper chaperone PCu(A)C n=1 Tax=Rhodopila sp. TaxID=2480087 RepID=UPI002D1237D2|nr:copper chaperone PCu(A)C [Rhodopila sp.]HVZ07297.1 copper chaperone PCu(A)C [Rhodopila sp.]